MFVNSIAQVVSDECIVSLGSINKNIGDAFLMVWKWKQRDNNGTAVESQVPCNQTMELAADSSLNACSIMADRIRHSKHIQAFAQVKQLQERMGNDFTISTGFGLHIGWAIEGAIGSEMKIDATYLSGHTKLSDSLEGLTRPYACDILMSHWFYEALSDGMKQLCRPVDCVLLSGSPVPVTLYTYQGGHDKRLQRETCNHARRYFTKYIDGDWTGARMQLTQFLEENPKDGPGTAVADFMESHGDEPPGGWAGWRLV